MAAPILADSTLRSADETTWTADNDAVAYLVPGVGLVKSGARLLVPAGNVVEQARPSVWTGTGAATLLLPTASGAGTKERKGTGAATLPVVTAAGDGTKERKGTGAASLLLPTASGAGTKARPGTGAAALPLLTAAGAGTKARPGTGAASLPLLTAAGAGSKARSGTGAADLPLLTADGAGQVDEAGVATGSGTPSLPLLTAAGTGEIVVARAKGAGPPDRYRKRVRALEVASRERRDTCEIELVVSVPLPAGYGKALAVELTKMVRGTDSKRLAKWAEILADDEEFETLSRAR